MRRLIDVLVTALIEGSAEAAREAQVETPEDVRRHPQRLARLAPEAAEASRQLKALLRRRVYRSAALERESQQSGEQLRRLFEYYVRLPEKMPSLHRDRLGEEPVHRVVCDYLAGMTDKYVLRQYAERFQG